MEAAAAADKPARTTLLEDLAAAEQAEETQIMQLMGKQILEAVAAAVPMVSRPAALGVPGL